MKEVDHDEGGYKGKKNQFQNSIPNCQHQSQLSISHQKIWAPKLPSQIKNFPKKNYQMVQE